MNEWHVNSYSLMLGVSFLVGMGLALLYFRMLWATVKRFALSRHPLAFVLGSFVFRMLALLTGFYLVMGGKWTRLALAMLGFMVMREIYLRRFCRADIRKATWSS